MKSQLIVFILLSLLLTACSPQVTVTSEVTVTLQSPTETPIPKPTEVPLEALPVEELVQKYLAGELKDLSPLTNEHLVEFSVALAELRNEEAGINFVSFTYLNGEKYYLNPDTLAMEKVPANPNDEFLQENSFEIYMPIKFDTQSNVMYFYNNEWRTLPNSAGFDFRMRITDPNHSIVAGVDIPKITEGEFAGLTPLQKELVNTSNGLDSTLVPVVPLTDALGEIIFEVGPSFRDVSVFRIVTFYTDDYGNPILAKASLLMPSGAFLLYEEGESTMITSTSKIREYGEFWETLEHGQIYFLTIANDPVSMNNSYKQLSIDSVEGVSLENAQTKEVSLFIGTSFIKRKID